MTDKRIGAKFWEARSSHGRKPLWDDPEVLKAACIEYFEWVEKSPLWEYKPMIANGEIQDVPIEKMRAMTLGGLCVFLGIVKNTWVSYKEKKDFVTITAFVEEVIREQKVTGAAAGLLNANIIAREVGLKDQSETDITSAGDKLETTFNFLPVNSKA